MFTVFVFVRTQSPNLNSTELEHQRHLRPTYLMFVFDLTNFTLEKSFQNFFSKKVLDPNDDVN